MKVVILAGGLGTRISAETNGRPKPMVEIGGKPLLWHIMKIYSSFGFNDFIIACGYKSEVIKNYFKNGLITDSDIKKWNVQTIDTGEHTMTGGRIKRLKDYIGNETFLLTYGDGLSDVDINALIDFHKKEKPLVTLTAVRAPGRYGTFKLKEGETKIVDFREKPEDDDIRINGGFFVLEPEIFNYINGDDTSWEIEPIQKISREGNLKGYRHNGFWQSMDTLKDKQHLEKIWSNGSAPWKLW